MREETAYKASDIEIAQAVVEELSTNPETVKTLVKELKSMKINDLGKTSKRLASVLLNGFSLFMDVKNTLEGNRSRGQAGKQPTPVIQRIINNLPSIPTTGKEG